MATQSKAAFNQIAEKVKAIPVALAVGSDIQLYDSRRHEVSVEELATHRTILEGLCPFHADTRLGSFKVTPYMKRWQCFTCDIGGSGIDFIMKHHGMEFHDAVYHIARRFNIMSEEDYQRFARKKADADVVMAELPEIDETDEGPACTDKADADVVNAVYSAMPIVLGLSKKHRQHLLRERGLSEEDLKDYFSFPSRSTDIVRLVFHKIVGEICQKKFGKREGELDANEIEVLKKHKGIKRLQEQMELVPGFFFNRSRNMFQTTYRQGIGFIVRDHNGKAVGIQVRQDTVKASSTPSKEEEEERRKAINEGLTRYGGRGLPIYEMVEKAFAGNKSSRYVWFSSSFAARNQKAYRGGASSGCPGGVIFPEGDREKAPIVITEGRFKAVSIAKKGNIAIYVSGVSTWQTVLPMVEALKGNRKTIFVMFDADLMGNTAVHGQLAEMSKALKEMGLRVDMICWRISLGKGIDDLIQKERGRYKEYLKVVRFDDFERIHSIIFERLLSKAGVKVPKDLKGNDRVWFNIDMQLAVEDALKLPEKDN